MYGASSRPSLAELKAMLGELRVSSTIFPFKSKDVLLESSSDFQIYGINLNTSFFRVLHSQT